MTDVSTGLSSEMFVTEIKGREIETTDGKDY